MIQIEQLESYLKTVLGLPTTFEHPGYISIVYRSHDINIGIDGENTDELLLQVSTNDGIFCCEDMKAKLNEHMSYEHVANWISTWLTMTYVKIDQKIKEVGYN